jgi:hypothetical protein
MAARIAQKIDYRLLRLVTHLRPRAFVRVNMYQLAAKKGVATGQVPRLQVY